MIRQAEERRLHRTGEKIMRIGKISLLMVLVLGAAGWGFAQDERGPEKRKTKISSTIKEVQGEISWMNDKYIAISYNRDLVKGTEDEMLLPIDRNIRLEHKQGIDEIKAGDLVRVSYDEETEEDEKGEKRDSRKARVISFIKAGAKKESPAPADESLEEDTLTFKSLKSEGEVSRNE